MSALHISLVYLPKRYWKTTHWDHMATEFNTVFKAFSAFLVRAHRGTTRILSYLTYCDMDEYKKRNVYFFVSLLTLLFLNFVPAISHIVSLVFWFLLFYFVAACFLSCFHFFRSFLFLFFLFVFGFCFSIFFFLIFPFFFHSLFSFFFNSLVGNPMFIPPPLSGLGTSQMSLTSSSIQAEL